MPLILPLVSKRATAAGPRASPPPPHLPSPPPPPPHALPTTITTCPPPHHHHHLLQVLAYLLAAVRALAVGHTDMMQRIALFCLGPTVFQLALMLGRPDVYSRHRVVVSMLARLPQDAWLVLWQEVPELGAAGAWLAPSGWFRLPSMGRAMKLEFVAVGEAEEGGLGRLALLSRCCLNPKP